MAGTTNRVANQGVWIGAGFTTEDSSATTALLPGQLGQVVIQADKAYQLVQFDTTANGLATVAAGQPVLWKTPASFLVTNDYDVITAARNFPAGVALLANTSGYYGWIQVAGPYATVVTNGDDDIGQGDTIIYGAADGVVDSVAAGTASTFVPLGIATAADVDANNTVAVYLSPPHNGW